MNEAEHSAAAPIRMLLVKALLERFIHKCHSHKAAQIVLILSKH